MQLLIVRHADAGDAGEFAKTGDPDSLRPLSKKGRRQMRAAARALAELVPDPDIIVSSPYTRAVQTRTLLADAYGTDVPCEETETLEPESEPDAFTRWLRTHASANTVVAAGHEPHLSALVTWLMTGSADSRMELKKGGACLLEMDERVAKGEAVLRWLLTPKQLSSIAGD